MRGAQGGAEPPGRKKENYEPHKRDCYCSTRLRAVTVSFRKRIDVDCLFAGNRYRPSRGTLEMLRKVARQMEVDFDFVGGGITLRRRTQRAAELARVCEYGVSRQIGDCPKCNPPHKTPIR